MVTKLPQKRYNPDSHSIYKKSNIDYVVGKISKGNIISPE